MENLAVIILAAGKGTRMKSTAPKVLHGFAGRPMLGHILAATEALNPSRTVVITGFGAEAVESYCTANFKNIEFARQTEQKGTGHAVQMCAEALGKHTGPIMILYGDVMLNMRPDVLPALIAAHAKNANGLTLLGASVENPTGLGRMIQENNRVRVVEEKDCTDLERKCKTANPGIYAIHGPLLWPLVANLTPNNAQSELYLTDIVEAAHSHAPVTLVEVPSERAEMGINSRTELAAMDALWQSRKRESLMAQGVTLVGPETCFFSHDTTIGADSVVGPHVVCGVGVKTESDVTLLPFSHLEGCTIAKGVRVGPFARLRPTTTIGEDAHIGNFVELKNTTFGKGSKANHLTYVGDAEVGQNVNLGAGTITANYNSKTKVKSRTSIGDNVSTGSQTVMVAPIAVAEGTMTGAGTVLRKPTEAYSLVTDAREQVVKSGYAKK